MELWMLLLIIGAIPVAYMIHYSFYTPVPDVQKLEQMQEDCEERWEKVKKHIKDVEEENRAIYKEIGNIGDRINYFNMQTLYIVDIVPIDFIHPFEYQFKCEYVDKNGILHYKYITKGMIERSNNGIKVQ